VENSRWKLNGKAFHLLCSINFRTFIFLHKAVFNEAKANVTLLLLLLSITMDRASLSQEVTLWTCIREMTGLYLGRDADHPDVFLSLSTQITGCYVKLYHDCFLSHIFQFIIIQSFYVIYIYIVWVADSVCNYFWLKTSNVCGESMQSVPRLVINYHCDDVLEYEMFRLHTPVDPLNTLWLL
jgi:hypothetical protein